MERHTGRDSNGVLLDKHKTSPDPRGKNGMPPSIPYVYRGLGYDILDPYNTGRIYGWTEGEQHDNAST